jgi:hypothetical protein
VAARRAKTTRTARIVRVRVFTVDLLIVESM